MTAISALRFSLLLAVQVVDSAKPIVLSSLPPGSLVVSVGFTPFVLAVVSAQDRRALGPDGLPMHSIPLCPPLRLLIAHIVRSASESGVSYFVALGAADPKDPFARVYPLSFSSTPSTPCR